MISKIEYFITKKRLAKREDALFNQMDSADRDWREFCALSPDAQNKMRKEWDEYYRAVRRSPVYQVLQDFSKDCAIGADAPKNSASDWKSKGHIALAQSQIPKPSGFDPLFAEYKAQEVVVFINETKAMRKVVDEYRDIYEPAQRGGGGM